MTDDSDINEYFFRYTEIENGSYTAVLTKLFSNSLAAKKQVYKFDLSSF